jgi:hypothetical protein
MAKGVKFGRKPKLSDYQRQEALKRRAAGETLAEIAKATPSSELIRELPACSAWLPPALRIGERLGCCQNFRHFLLGVGNGFGEIGDGLLEGRQHAAAGQRSVRRMDGTNPSHASA